MFGIPNDGNTEHDLRNLRDPAIDFPPLECPSATVVFLDETPPRSERWPNVPIEVPHEVALFLNILGVPYPDIDEEQIHLLAEEVRSFATDVWNTHASSFSAIQQMGSAYSGCSYEQLIAAWASKSESHVRAADAACRTVATALDAAAEVVTIVKAAVLTELAVLAATYATLAAAALATGGMAAMAQVAITVATRRLCDAMESALMWYIVSEVVSKAIEPLEHTIDRLIHGIADDTANRLLGVPPPNTSSTSQLYIDPDEVWRYADVLDNLADDILRCAQQFSNNVAALDFTTPARTTPIVANKPYPPVNFIERLTPYFNDDIPPPLQSNREPLAAKALVATAGSLTRSPFASSNSSPVDISADPNRANAHDKFGARAPEASLTNPTVETVTTVDSTSLSNGLRNGGIRPVELLQTEPVAQTNSSNSQYESVSQPDARTTPAQTVQSIGSPDRVPASSARTPVDLPAMEAPRQILPRETQATTLPWTRSRENKKAATSSTKPLYKSPSPGPTPTTHDRPQLLRTPWSRTEPAPSTTNSARPTEASTSNPPNRSTDARLALLAKQPMGKDDSTEIKR
ncbi:WXG100-like domain-containing protein [Nocardia brasiliensis]